MKRVLVLGLTAGLILFLGLTASRGRYAAAPSSLFKGEVADALAAERVAEPMPVMAAPAPPPADAPKQRLKRAAPKRDQNEALSGLMGSAEGGGGIGLGGIGTRGRGGAKEAKLMLEDDREQNAPAEEAPGSGAEASTRAWFPETFLFEPLVLTDAQGKATVPVKVPDRLTNWRVLALAHAREGAQAGAVTSFVGTLPVYVDPIVPAFLFAGDRVQLPVQVVNTTAQSVSTSLALSATGGSMSGGAGSLTVNAFGNALRQATLDAPRPGNVVVRAALGTTDAVERSIPVKPAGTPQTQTRGGTLGAPRTLTVVGPTDALPGSEQVQLSVFPGGLGLLRSELAAAPYRGGVAEDAYLLTLLGRAPGLLRSLGADAEAQVLRDLTVLATQRAMRHARSPSVDDATLLAQAALAHGDNPVLARLGERLAQQVAQAQRPDGTCQGENGWTLQRLLATTADCVRAVRTASTEPKAVQRASAVRLKAAGAFERNLSRIDDAYTAAAALASGAVTGSSAERLKKLVVDAIKDGEDGAKYLAVDTSAVVRADGRPPSPYEATALAVLALQGDPKAPLADLGSFLLGGYSAGAGWGDGRTNLVALEAVVGLFKDPVPSSVEIVLSRDGKPLAQGTFDAAKLKDVLTLEADATGSTGSHTWTVSATPPVAGLGYSLALGAYVPWKDTPGRGLELTQKLPPTLEVGRAAPVELTAAVPAGLPSILKFGLPAGVQADAESLQQLVGSAINRYEQEDGLVTLHLNPLAAGALATLNFTVVPTLAGSLRATPPSLAVEDRPETARVFGPRVWDIR